MSNIVKPRTVSLEDALRDLAARVCAQPKDSLPRTQEGIVQFMADNLPTRETFINELAGLVAQIIQAEAAENGVEKSKSK